MPRRSRSRQSGEAPGELLTVAREGAATRARFRRGDEDESDFENDEEYEDDEWDEDEEEEDLEQEDLDELEF